VKVAGSKVIVKQRCPVHGGRAFKVPLKDKDKYIHLIQNAVFRCYKTFISSRMLFFGVINVDRKLNKVI